MFHKIVGKFSYILGAIGAGILAILMFVTGIDVIGRYVFHRPFTGAYEISELSMAAVVLLGWGYTQAQKSHIDIDLAYAHLPHIARNVLDFLVPLLGIGLFVFIGWQSINFVIDSIGWHEATDMLDIPVWIFKLMIFIGSVALSLQFVDDIVTACRKARGKA